MGCSCSKNAALALGCQHCWVLCRNAANHQTPKERRLLRRPNAVGVDDAEVSCHASAGANWHLELLAVSTELKEKLQDPQFVATRCDLDGSGDLDAHELKQAARVYGISQSGSSQTHDGTNPRLMAGQRVSKESFAEMVASQQSTKLIRAFDSNTIKVLLGGTCPQNALTISTCISILAQFRSAICYKRFFIHFFVQRLFSGSTSESA